MINAMHARRSVIFLTLALSLGACATTTDGPAGRSLDESRYTNPIFRWSVAYPRDWDIDARTPRSIIFRKEGPRPGWVGIHAIPGAGDKSLDDTANSVLRIYPAAKYVPISRRNITLANGSPAIEVVHHVGSGVVGKSRKVITIAKGRAFLIDAETYLDFWNDVEPYFNRMIDSFAVQD